MQAVLDCEPPGFPRELTWIIGVFLLLLTLGVAFTGQVLRFDQDAYRGLGIGASIVSRVPLIGGPLVGLMLGDPIIAGPTPSPLSLRFTSSLFPASCWRRSVSYAKEAHGNRLMRISVRLSVWNFCAFSRSAQRRQQPNADHTKKNYLQRQSPFQPRGKRTHNIHGFREFHEIYAVFSPLFSITSRRFSACIPKERNCVAKLPADTEGDVKWCYATEQKEAYVDYQNSA